MGKVTHCNMPHPAAATAMSCECTYVAQKMCKDDSNVWPEVRALLGELPLLLLCVCVCVCVCVCFVISYEEL